MTLPFWFELAWKSAAIAGATLVILRLLAGRSAAERSFVAHLGLFLILLLPLGAAAIPKLRVTPPAAFAEAMPGLPEASLHRMPGSPVPAARSPTAAPDHNLIRWLYWGPPVALLLLLVVAVVRLAGLRKRAAFPADPRWHAAMAAAQARLGFQHGAVLLVSPEVAAPVSWGLLRPTILLGLDAQQDVRHAEAILAHELAHVARYDWLKLLAARIATALFWFNPLVWALARTCHDLCEEAADDAVLRAQVNAADYAGLLVEMARRGARPRGLAVHGVAPCSAFGRRVTGLLDPERRRASAGAVWKLGSVVLALGVAVPVTGVDLIRSPAPPGGSASGAGDRTAAGLEALDHPAARTLAQAMRQRDWEARKAGEPTLFHLPAAIPLLVSALGDEDPVVRRIAIWGLSEMRPAARPAASAVAAHLQDTDPQVRGEAARALGDFGAISHADAIARLLHDDHAGVAAAAAHALGDLRQPDTRSALAAASDHPDRMVRARVTWALGQVPEP